MAPPSIPAETRAAILEEIQAPSGPPSYRELAARHGVSRWMIAKIAEEAGLADVWEGRRYRTEAATADNVARLAQKRAQLQEAALDAAAEWLERRNEPFQVVTRMMEGTEVDEIRPGPDEWKAIGQGVQSLSTSAVAFARLESDLSGAGQASGLLEQFEIELREDRQRREAASRAGELDE